MYPTETEAMVQKTKGFVTGLLTKSSRSDYTASNFKTFQRVVIDPNPSRDVAYPTARLLGPELTEEEVKKAPFRPHILTDSINPPVTPRHGAGEVGVFLYRNGFSEDPLNAIVSRDKLCPSPDALASTLSAEVDEEWGCTEAGGCRVFLHNGWEVSNCEELVEDDKLWLVPRHREFMWPTFKRGHLVEVRHVASGNGEPIVVETLSESPKVFRLNNFFTSEEADELIDNALNLNDPINGLHRSTTGQGTAAQEDSHRTSDNAWDMVSPASLRLKRRIFELLGIRPYNNAWADGLQILRYNTTQAYNSHFDYLETTPTGRLNSARRGGANRFATVVVYLTDVEVGGETVFPEGKALDGTDKSYDEVLAEMKEQNIDMQAIGIKAGSWQERLVVQCRSKLAVRPMKAQAVLFYDQLPEGGQDDASLHGGCPVLQGVKWAANLWVWNGNVHGPDEMDGSSSTDGGDGDGSHQAEFVSLVPGHSLYWQDTFFAELVENVPMRMNTFNGHVFHIYEGRSVEEKGSIVATYTMKAGRSPKDVQTYTFDGYQEEEEEDEEYSDEEEDEEMWEAEEMWSEDGREAFEGEEGEEDEEMVWSE
jgi:prolyl 4-hydroxylase